MSVSAIRPRTPHGTTFSHRKRARRFLGAMAAALREAGCRTDDGLAEKREADALRARDLVFEFSAAA